MSARKEEKREKMNRRQRKKAYKKVNGYNPNKEQAAQQMIRDMIEYTERRLVEAEKERVNRTYSGFLESIKQRPRSKVRWWRRTR